MDIRPGVKLFLVPDLPPRGNSKTVFFGSELASFLVSRERSTEGGVIKVNLESQHVILSLVSPDI